MLATVETTTTVKGGPKIADDADKRVGGRITLLRKSRGVTQTVLGKHIGVTFQQVQKYEKGTNRVGAGRLSKIAAFLDVPVAALLDESSSNGIMPDFLGPMKKSGAPELLEAYAAIEDASARKHLLALARSFARMSGLKDEDPDVAS